jgi:hypothetical protein
LLPTLKGNILVRFKAEPNGKSKKQQDVNYFKVDVRYRDAVISSGEKSIYPAADSKAISSEPLAQNPLKAS